MPQAASVQKFHLDNIAHDIYAYCVVEQIAETDTYLSLFGKAKMKMPPLQNLKMLEGMAGCTIVS